MTLCRSLEGRAVSSHGDDVDLREACDVLAKWNGRMDEESRGALLFSRYWTFATAATMEDDSLWSVPFDPEDPIHTPIALTLHDVVCENGRRDSRMEHKHAKHIGIVGCSSEGAALCYRTICLEASAEMGEYFHPEVSLHTHSLGDYMTFVRASDWEGVAQLMLSSAHKLANAGAELLICPDNTVHQAFSHVVSRSPLPWLHIAEEVVRQARERGYRRLGVLGTRSLMESPVYAEQLARSDIEHVTPSLEDRIAVDAIIFKELVNGKITGPSRQRVKDVIGKLESEANCDAVVLGCTELPLLVAWDSAPLAVLDSTRLLARAALRAALG